VTETATKPSPTPLQKHSPGGCTIDMRDTLLQLGELKLLIAGLEFFS